MKDLLEGPTVLELRKLNDEDNALVMLFLLTFIREYCETTRVDSSLQHVILIEEAHRVMSKVSSSSDREISTDTKAQSVGMLVQALSEARNYGQGVIIAEQIPGRLVEDVLKNTNSKIIHKLPGFDDREIVGGTIKASKDDTELISLLNPGEAVFFTDGYTQPAFVTVPDIKSKYGFKARILDEQIKEHMNNVYPRDEQILLPFNGCHYCLSICRHRDRVGEVAYAIHAQQKFYLAISEFEKQLNKGEETAAWQALARVCKGEVRYIPSPNEDMAYCYFSHLWDRRVTEQTAYYLRRAIRGLSG
jgi:hypothetical protein